MLVIDKDNIDGGLVKSSWVDGNTRVVRASELIAEAKRKADKEAQLGK